MQVCDRYCSLFLDNCAQIVVNDIEMNADQLRLSVHPGFALDVMRRFVKPVVSSMLVVTKDLSELGLLGKSANTAGGGNVQDDFGSLMKLFRPTMHLILMIWKNSKCYNTPGRLVVLVREICNALIKQSCDYVSGEEIFRLIDENYLIHQSSTKDERLAANINRKPDSNN